MKCPACNGNERHIISNTGPAPSYYECDVCGKQWPMEPKLVNPLDLRREGGVWLGAARSWVQQHCSNGSEVKWGSQTELKPPLTMRDVEELAAEVAAAAINSIRKQRVEAPKTPPPCPKCKSNQEVFDGFMSWQCRRCDTSFIP